MRHCRRAGRPLRTKLLVEITQGNVGPAIRRKIMSNASEARNIAVELTLPVMRLDLSRQRVPRQTKALHKILRKKRPGNLGQSNAVSSPRSSGSVHLAQVFRVFNS